METDPDLRTEAFIYVDHADGLARLTGALRGAMRVGLDTEADSLHHYFDKVCLIQLSFSGTDYIVDPLAGLSLSGFLEVLSEKELIIQGADYDLRMLKKSFGFRPKASVFDTMQAAQVLGYEQIGLGALVERFCGTSLTHSGQKSDWSRRPLSPGQLRYASDDTKYLEAIADALAAELRKLHRTEWHRECCERAIELSGLPAKAEGKKEAWRVKGTSGLCPKTLAFVRELWKWRDEEARQRDRPPFMVLKNEDMIEVAAWRVMNPNAPAPPAFPSLKRITGNSLARLERAIKSADSLPPEAWPALPERPRPIVERASPEEVEALMTACKAIANELRIEPCFLAARAALTAVVRRRPRSVDEVMEVSGMMRWQASQVMSAVQAVLGGQK